MLSSIMTLVFLFIPANVLALYAGVALQGKRVPAVRLLLFGAAAGLALSLARSLPGPFGVHAILQTLLLLVLLRLLTNGKWSMVLIGTLLPQLLTAIGEGLIAAPIMVGVLGLSLAEIVASPGHVIVAGWLGNILLVLLCLILYVRQHRGTGMGP